MARPVLYLDVDGVINFLKHRHKGKPYEWDDIERDNVASPIEGHDGTFKITYSKTLSAQLLNLDCDIKWLTTWGAEANKLISPLVGLPEDLEVAGTYDDWRVRDTRASGLYVITTANWKLDAVQRDQNDNPRPFIWADDDAIDKEAQEWLAKCPIPYLAVAPDSRDGGLTPTHVMYMREFISAVGEKEEV